MGLSSPRICSALAYAFAHARPQAEPCWSFPWPLPTRKLSVRPAFHGSSTFEMAGRWRSPSSCDLEPRCPSRVPLTIPTFGWGCSDLSRGPRPNGRRRDLPTTPLPGPGSGRLSRAQAFKGVMHPSSPRGPESENGTRSCGFYASHRCYHFERRKLRANCCVQATLVRRTGATIIEGREPGIQVNHVRPENP